VHDVQKNVYARLTRDAGFSSRNTVSAVHARARARAGDSLGSERRERGRERERGGQGTKLAIISALDKLASSSRVPIATRVAVSEDSLREGREGGKN